MRWRSLIQILAPPAVAAARVRGCNGCVDRRGAKCRRCGCWIAAKVRLAAGKCPAGRWLN